SLTTGTDFSRVVQSASPAGCANAVPCQIGPNQNVTFRVTANPQSIGAKSDTLNIATNIPGGGVCGPVMAAIPLAANGVVPDVNVAPSALAFNDRDVQATPATLPVTISNTGTATLNVSDIQITGTDAGRFSFSANTLPFDIPLASSAVVDVTYTPGIAGVNHSASLHVFSDGDSNMDIDIPLTGRGIDRVIAVDPLSVDFPPTYRNPSTPTRRSLTIRNDGEAPLAITMVSKSGGGENAFTVVDTVPPTIDGLTSQIVDLDFTPTSSGTFAADLVISNDDNDQPMVMVPLSGMGVVPNFQPVNAACDITVGVGIPTSITASTNCGDGIGFTNAEPVALNVRDIKVIDADGNDVDPGMARVVGFTSSDVNAGELVSVDVEITAPEAMQYPLRVQLFVEDDPVMVSQVTINVNAIDVELRGGGCDAGGGRGSALTALLLLGLAAAGRRTSRRARGGAMALLLALSVAGGAAPARADRTRNLDLATFRPMPAVEAELVTIDTPRVGESGSWVLGLFFNYAVNPLTLRSPQEPGMVDALVSGRTGFDLAFSYAFLRRFEAGLVVPMLQQSGDQVMVVQGVPAADGFSLGDVALHGKAFLAAADPFRVGGSLTLTLPTATDGEFAGVNGPTGHGQLLAEIQTGRIQVAANAGFRLRAGSQFGDLDQGNEVTYGVGAGYRVTRALSAIGELFGATGIGGEGSSKGASPLEAGVGVRWRANRAVALAAGAGFGLQPGIGAPAERGYLLLTYSPRASAIKELPRGTGPLVDRRDSDQDGIINADDKCPEEAEDIDKFEDADGCADEDNDRDGFPDGKDLCPNAAEDTDKFKDDDGCPDEDNDGDKILDADDKCPDEPEDIDGFQDRDGCDDPDNDGDGIPDVIDGCATEAETINGNKDEDGCPDDGESLVMVMPDRIEVFEPVRFEGRGAKILKKSENVLGQVAATLRANRDFLRIRVAVHVHPRGADDQQVSEHRAKAVREWLIKWGIEPERLEVKGYGSTRPLVPPNKHGAAEVNDRVEFILLEKKMK
ncbi:MAG TPA: choice-of-anchor D domain-containing protein, partial [Kofleriaceae bacterium]|nr:choice-of-anchor D domain-containing protein [Kofleriaceae bacterium]